MNKLTLALLVLCGCGPAVMMTEDDLPPIDESVCSRGRIEDDGIDSSTPMALPAGNYLISTTYLRLPLKKSALARFRALTSPIDDALRRNAGVVQVVTRLSTTCNTARTLTVWKDEASMYELVGSPEHSAAMAAVKEVSRGGSIVTHWVDDGTGATWTEAAKRLDADSGPFY